MIMFVIQDLRDRRNRSWWWWRTEGQAWAVEGVVLAWDHKHGQDRMCMECSRWRHDGVVLYRISSMGVRGVALQTVGVKHRRFKRGAGRRDTLKSACV